MTTLKRYTGSAWETIGQAIYNSGPAAALGYSEVVANQTPGAVFNAVTVTVPAGRRIRLTAKAFAWSTVANDVVALDIKEGTNVLQISQTVLALAGSNGNSSVQTEVVISPSAGTHTYTMVVRLSVGTGTISVSAGPSIPAFLLVEDVTGSTLPYDPSSVPVGVLAQAQVVAPQTGITTETLIAGLSVNVAVPAGRVLKVTLYAGGTRSVTDGTGVFRIKEGATVLERLQYQVNRVNEGVFLTAAAIVSPSAGAHTYTVTLENTTGTGTVGMDAGADRACYLMVEDITSTPAAVSTGAPGSTLGYAEVITGQNGITSEVDLVNLSVTITVPAGRRIRIIGSAGVYSDVANDTGVLYLKEGAGYLQFSRHTIDVAGRSSTFPPVTAIISPSAGTHTYKLSLAREVGSGTFQMVASSIGPSFLLVEDITGALWPTGSPVTAGMVASEAWNDWVPALTSLTIGNGTVTAKYVKLGRTVHYKFKFVLGSTSAVGINPTITPPVPLSADYAAAGADSVGDACLYDAGVNNFHGQVWISAGNFNPVVRRADGTYVNSALIGATVPHTWGTGDVLSFHGTYEAAA